MALRLHVINFTPLLLVIKYKYYNIEMIVDAVAPVINQNVKYTSLIPVHLWSMWKIVWLYSDMISNIDTHRTHKHIEPFR